MSSDRYLDLSKGEADVAFRSGEPVDDTLVGRKICDSVWAIYASKSYVQQWGRPTSIADLADHALLGFDGIMENHAREARRMGYLARQNTDGINNENKLSQQRISRLTHLRRQGQLSGRDKRGPNGRNVAPCCRTNMA